MPIINTVTGGGKGKFIDTTIKPDSFPTISEPPAPYDGWSKVTVEAPDNLDSQNIKQGVVIAGVEGSYSPPLQSKTEVPYSFPVKVETDEGYYGLSDVTVVKPDNLESENIKKGVSIAGVSGTYDPQPVLEIVDVKPAVLPMTVVADTDYDGLKQVNIDKPDNLSSENIKKDVNIAGVVGSYEGSITPLDEKMLKIFSGNGSDVSLYDTELKEFTGSGNTYSGIPLSSVSLKEYHYGRAMSGYINYSVLKNIKSRFTLYLDLYYISRTNIGLLLSNSSDVTIIFEGDVGKILYGLPIEGCGLRNDVVYPEGLEQMYHYSGIINKCYKTDGSNKSSLSYTFPMTMKKIGSLPYDYSYPTIIIMKSSSPPSLESGYSTIGKIVVPKGTLDAYKSATNWSKYADIMVEAEE